MLKERSRAAFELRFLRLTLERAWAAFRERRLPPAGLIWRQLQQLRGELLRPRSFGERVAPWYAPDGAFKETVTARAKAELRELLRSDQRIVLPRHEQPAVSVVVVTFNRAELTLRCLRALAAVSEPSFELILVDNGSTDESGALFDRLDGATILRRPENEGFVRAVNLGAAQARGPLLALLNNDAELGRHSLSVAARELARPELGAVVGPIVLLDGMLQEAGSIIWSDGSCSGYGRGERPDAPWFGFARDVDFGSAAFVVTPLALFRELGGFDEGYSPAYYEDVDYCVRLWRAGRAVRYLPGAVIRHFEFASSRDPEAARLLQEKNRVRFRERHADWLAQQHAPGRDVLGARARHAGKRVLFIDDRVPQQQLGSGFPRALDLVRSLVDDGAFVTLLTTVRGSDLDRGPLPDGVEIVGDLAPARLLAERPGYYDRVLVSRPHNLRRLPRGPLGARLIYDAEAIYAERDLALRGASPPEIRRAVEAELALARRADVVLAVSDREASRFAAAGAAKVMRLGHALSPAPTGGGFAERAGLLFVGAFHDSGSPNSLSMEWFVREVLPRVLRALPEARLTIAGARPPASVRALAGPSVELLADPAELEPLYRRARLFIAPTRGAAGVPYKVHHAAAHGLPVVATSLLAEQLGWRDGQQLLIADGARFADACIELYSSPELWERLRRGALAAVERDCDPAAFRRTLRDALE